MLTHPAFNLNRYYLVPVVPLFPPWLATAPTTASVTTAIPTIAAVDKPAPAAAVVAPAAPEPCVCAKEAKGTVRAAAKMSLPKDERLMLINFSIKKVISKNVTNY